MKRITYREFEAYMALCRHYGWKPTIEGLLANASGARKALLKHG